jgi:hypothetical protein
MHETLPSQYWHYQWSDGVQYPSCAGLSAKWVTTIKIYSAPESDWTLQLDGTGIGGLRYNVSKTFFEQALVCQFGANHSATYTDSNGRVWEGMALWFLAGFVDDSDQHSSNAFNESLALAGYKLVITASDGYYTVIDSKNIIRNTNYIVANSLNGSHLNNSDENWPLRLTGANVSSSSTVKKVSSIRLLWPAPGDVNGDNRINACDITQCELCILNPEKYPKDKYFGWDANEDGEGPNAGDILGVELRILGLWH